MASQQTFRVATASQHCHMANLSVSLLNMTKAIELKISVRGLKPNQKDQINDLLNQLPHRLSKKKKTDVDGN